MPEYDFHIHDINYNGEFLSFATVDLIVDGQIVETEQFVGTSEFPDEESAFRQANSYAVSWLDSMTTTLEERLAPFGIEWEREQAERGYC